MFGFDSFAKTLILIGIILIIVGSVLYFGGRFLHFGNLPGDIQLEGEKIHFYFPVVTCIFLSIILTIIINLISHR
ncbi:MAG: DUF2905 domain-containing protein [Veillonellales bacterium]